jgi:hypothetical protein
MMTNKQKMELLLAGGTPDIPPHWDLGFQIEKEMFGMDLDAVANASYVSEQARTDAVTRFHVEVQERLIEDCGWAAVNALNMDQVKAMKKAVGDRALVNVHDWEGVFYMPTGDTIMDFVTRLFEEPEELHTEARRKCDAAKERFSKYVDAGVDFFILAHDFGFNAQPFVSPAHFGEFIAPYLAECVEHIHSIGSRAILHSDGCLHGILEQIHATGVDGWQSIDPQGHMDIKAVREEFPDWLLMGNVNCAMLQNTDEAAIRESVRYCMTYGGLGKRYIFSASNVIYEGMPAESYRIMLDEYEKICRNASL